MNLPKRKPNRLKNYSYNSDGSYFITICTHNHKCILWDTVGAGIARPQDVPLSRYGHIAGEAIKGIAEHYQSVTVDKYVIMPNHIHLILTIDTFGGRAMPAPTISVVVAQMKGFASKKADVKLWQKLFHDHIIRNEKEYELIWNYIEANPCRWREDCFYIE